MERTDFLFYLPRKTLNSSSPLEKFLTDQNSFLKFKERGPLKNRRECRGTQAFRLIQLGTRLPCHKTVPLLGNFELWSCAHTARKIPFIYSFSGNCAAAVRKSTFECLWAIYIFPGLVYIFPCSRIGRPILEIYKSLTDFLSLGTGRTNVIILFWK
jgi:hypothetical protein